MPLDVNELTKNIFKTTSLLDSDDIPDIGLYMDQVTTLLENNLHFLDRAENERVLTKTMINNYTKSNMLPSPEKKKYTKDHILLLSFIYYFKTVLSIGEIKILTTSLREKYFNNQNELSLEDIYKVIAEHISTALVETNDDINKKISAAKTIFTDLPEDESENLQTLALISSLSYDIFVKQYLITQLIDSMNNEDISDDKTKKKTKEKNKEKN